MFRAKKTRGHDLAEVGHLRDYECFSKSGYSRSRRRSVMHKSVAKSFVLEMELFDTIAAYGFRNQTYAWENEAIIVPLSRSIHPPPLRL